ncbi:COG4315 family predicted lipoprotein [Simplicispira psychrophila]|uniref:COG4315 family predicted lipoprotein n=1 Tax=Simplicispira psychrophila TaxID=80882 RepID=UPI001FE086A2|nr:ATP-binding protein [Simplicispira psychrophila]
MRSSDGSMGNTQRNNAMQGDNSQAKSSMQHQARDMPTRASDGRLIGPNGHTVYTFARDSSNAGTSACYDQCAQNWPPLTAAPTAQATGDYSIITRTDGTRQWAFKGQPMYYFARDAQPGDKVGDGAMSGAWKVITP